MSARVGRETVLDAAENLLDSGGFESLSVRRLAGALGVSRQVVYTHFGGVDGLLDALHERTSARLATDVAAVEGDPGSIDHFQAITRVYVAVARRRPHLYQLVFENPVADYLPSSKARRAGRASFGHIVAAADAWLNEQSSSVPDDESTWPAGATELARVLWTAGHGFVALERAGYAQPAETDVLVDRAVRAVLTGWSEA